MPLFVIERHFAEQIEMTRDRASVSFTASEAE